MSPEFLNLCNRGWSIPIIAELERRSGARFVELCGALGIPKRSARLTLDELLAAGVVRRNLGYGHPLRPEYLADPALGVHCLAVWQEVERLNSQALARSKWTLPISLALHCGAYRYRELAHRLGGPPDASLSGALRQMEVGGWVDRRVKDGRPPFALYLPDSRTRLVRVATVRLADALG